MGAANKDFDLKRKSDDDDDIPSVEEIKDRFELELGEAEETKGDPMDRKGSMYELTK